MNQSRSEALLGNVARRLRVVAFGRSWYRSFLAIAALFAVVLLASRLLGVIPDRFQWQTLAAVPILAALAAAFLHRPATTADAARAVDRTSGAKDLFLTTALLDNAPGEFKPLVAGEAERRAPDVKPGDVVPFDPSRRLATAACVLGVLFVGVWLLPQFDPFGRVSASEQNVREREKLNESKQATEKRLAEIRKERPQEAEAEEVKQAVNELKHVFGKMDPQQPRENVKKLKQNQKKLAEKWRDLSNKQLNRLKKQDAVAQQFGDADQDKLRKWTRELQDGSTDSLKKELDGLKDDVQQLKKETDPEKRREMAKRLQKKIEDVAELAGERLQSKELSEAAQRALEQLELAASEGNAAEALDALSKTLELTEEELEQLAQSAGDLKQIEEALRTLEMARQMNQQQPLDGAQCENCNSLSDYQELYSKLMAQQGAGGNGNGEGNGIGQGNGSGQGGNGKGNGGAFGGGGTGQGGIASEDDSIATKFKTEKAQSALVAGKKLLTLKTQGLGREVDAQAQYTEAVQSIREGASEAVLQERIPPGYHDGIKGYFDNIKDVVEPPQASP